MDESGAGPYSESGCKAVSEGANMPVDLAGVKMFKLGSYTRRKTQRRRSGCFGIGDEPEFGRISWSEEQLQEQLKAIMKDIHDTCATYGAGGYPTVSVTT